MSKEAERWYLEKFLESRPDIIIDDIAEHEPLDFLCMIAGQRIGIEVVRYYAPSDQRHPPQAIENFRRKLSDDLAVRSVKAGIPFGHYSVFSTRSDFGSSPQERNEIADGLINFVRRMGHPPEPKEYDYAALTDYLQEAGFDEISFYPNPLFSPPHWSFPNAHWVHRTVIQDMQNLINKKMEKLPSYKNYASTVWLLAVGGAGGIGSHLNADEQIFSANYSFEFDKVFVFDCSARKSYELKVDS